MNKQNSEAIEIPEVVEIETWLISYLAKNLDFDRDEIDTTVTFDHYGLDSTTAAFMTTDLEDWLKLELDLTLLYDYPTIEELSQHLASQVQNL